MDTIKTTITTAIARAEITMYALIRWLAIITVLTLFFTLTFFIAWVNRPDPYLIDYDAPGVDITSEGPDDYVDYWPENGGDAL